MHTMKKYLFVALFALAGLSCEEASKLTQFDMDVNENITIPAMPTALPEGYPFTFTFRPDMEAELASRGLSPDVLEEILLKSLVLKVTSPAGADFGFVKSVDMYVSAEGMDKVRFAYTGNVADDAGATLSLTTANVDLKNYFLQEKVKIEVDIATDEATTSPHTVNIAATFLVDVKVLGL